MRSLLAGDLKTWRSLFDVCRALFSAVIENIHEIRNLIFLEIKRCPSPPHVVVQLKVVGRYRMFACEGAGGVYKFLQLGGN